VRTTGEHDPEGCFTQQPDTPHKRKWALNKMGRTTQRVRQIWNTARCAQAKACARQGSTTKTVLHQEARQTGALREHIPGACVTSGTGRSARRTAVAVCRRPREEDAFEQDRPSTCEKTGMSGVPARLSRSGSLVRS